MSRETAPEGTTEVPDDASTCVVDGVGWIVCAVANFMATITDGMYEHVIANMLSVPPLNVDTADGENGTGRHVRQVEVTPQQDPHDQEPDRDHRAAEHGLARPHRRTTWMYAAGSSRSAAARSQSPNSGPASTASASVPTTSAPVEASIGQVPP